MAQIDFNHKITVIDSVRDRRANRYAGVSIADVLSMISDKRYANLDKLQRPCVCTSDNGIRPTGEDALDMWSGFQVMDLDIHNPEVAPIIKGILGQTFRGEPWFIAATLSSSHSGVHIYTMVEPPHKNLSREHRKGVYDTNFRVLYGRIYGALYELVARMLKGGLLMRGWNGDPTKHPKPVYEDDPEGTGLTATDKLLRDWIDPAMNKPAQIALIPYDPEIILNPGFKIEPLVISNDDEDGKEDKKNPNKIAYDLVAHLFTKGTEDIKKPVIERVQGYAAEVLNVESIGQRNPKHYRHPQRWPICNTLCAIYGLEKGLEESLNVLQVSTPEEVAEIRGYCNTAVNGKKGISAWACEVLNECHGFDIKYKITGPLDDQPSVEDITLPSMRGVISEFNESIELEEGQYIGSIGEQVTKKLVKDKMNVLVAGPGTGKTEYIKQLARTGRVLLIEPFTSTINSKIEGEDGWVCFYHNKNSNLKKEELTGARTGKQRLYDMYMNDPKLHLLIDNFGLKLSPDPIRDMSYMSICSTPDTFMKKICKWGIGAWDDDIFGGSLDIKYFVIDESHLLYTSGYRDVMPRLVQKLRGLLESNKHLEEDEKVTFLMMTGTPMGEDKFNENPNIISVKRKSDSRKKEFSIKIHKDAGDQKDALVRSIAKDINEGYKVLYPTNSGPSLCKKMQKAIDRVLKDDYGWTRKIKAFSYRKSQSESAEVCAVNADKTIGDNDLVLCTSYLSVGVDIIDKYKFRIYFTETHLPGEIDQWCNRLRSNDLIASLHVYKYDAEGSDLAFRNRMLTRELRYDSIVEKALGKMKVDVAMLNKIRQELPGAEFMGNKDKDMAELENDLNYADDPITRAFLLKMPYVVFNWKTHLYEIDEDAFRLNFWERQYRNFFDNYPALLAGMKDLGYETSIEDCTVPKEKPEEEEVQSKVLPAALGEEFREAAKEFQAEQNVMIEDCLDGLVTDSNMDELENAVRCRDGVEIRTGASEFRKVYETGEDKSNHAVIEVKDLDVFEKTIPMVLGLSFNFSAKEIRHIFEMTRSESGRYNFSELKRIRDFAFISTLNLDHYPIGSAARGTIGLIYKMLNANYGPCERREDGWIWVEKAQFNELMDDLTARYMYACGLEEIEIRIPKKQDEFGNPSIIVGLKNIIKDVFRALAYCKTSGNGIAFKGRHMDDYTFAEDHFIDPEGQPRKLNDMPDQDDWKLFGRLNCDLIARFMGLERGSLTEDPAQPLGQNVLPED